jgi:hypothetical protein
MLFKTAPMPQSANLIGDAGSAFAGSNALSTQMAPPNLASSFGQGLNSVGAGSGFGSGMGASGSNAANLLNQAGAAGSGWAGGIPAGTDVSFGGASFGSGAGGSLSGGVDPSAAGSGLQGGGGQPWLAYANIGKDLIMGGPGSEKITGSTAGDAAIRGMAAYFTAGLSEIPYALF